MPSRFAPTLILLGSVTLVSCSTPSASDGSYERFMGLAADLQQRGDTVTAAGLYEKATQLPQAQLEAWLKLGETRLANGDARGSERAYQQALERQPDSAAALLGLGSAQLRQGKLDRAVTVLTQASAQPDQPEAFNRLGIAQILRGRPDAAQAAFNQSLTMAPNDLDTRCNLALAYALGGKSQRALDTIHTVVESARALPRHQRNALLISVLAGREQDIRTLGLDDISNAQREKLLAEARRIKAMEDPQAQARELGLVDTH
ncbi:tetratricopeptide repeat protein [Pseudomonas sp. SWRI92]|uniref:tetratricopeptide repeat protein n=1 Tax=Pseudomonas sp. SWRI92 TaxID=2745499 RepID=UPI001648188A|nr:tetratricopeptide repeat protein [Pseudomonas sp. SWRI92]MBC3372384.1 tetratricopeptide repeat protein [Pseudomonas sp. SWRI92]